MKQFKQYDKVPNLSEDLSTRKKAALLFYIWFTIYWPFTVDDYVYDGGMTHNIILVLPLIFSLVWAAILSTYFSAQKRERSIEYRKFFIFGILLPAYIAVFFCLMNDRLLKKIKRRHPQQIYSHNREWFGCAGDDPAHPPVFYVAAKCGCPPFGW